MILSSSFFQKIKYLFIYILFFEKSLTCSLKNIQQNNNQSVKEILSKINELKTLNWARDQNQLINCEYSGLIKPTINFEWHIYEENEICKINIKNNFLSLYNNHIFKDFFINNRKNNQNNFLNVYNQLKIIKENILNKYVIRQISFLTRKEIIQDFTNTLEFNTDCHLFFSDLQKAQKKHFKNKLKVRKSWGWDISRYCPNGQCIITLQNNNTANIIHYEKITDDILQHLLQSTIEEILCTPYPQEKQMNIVLLIKYNILSIAINFEYFKDNDLKNKKKYISPNNIIDNLIL
jgi:hypothetical protein